MAGAAVGDATVLRRMVARGIEGLLLVLPPMVLLTLPEIIDATRDDREPDVDLPAIVGLATQSALFVVEVVLVVLAGGSLGKLLVGLRVETVDGGRPSWRQAAIRTAIYAAFPVSLVLLAAPGLSTLTALWDLALLVSILGPSDQRGWHDRASGTRVVRRR